MDHRESIEIHKGDITRELFLKTADQTYVVARMCYLNMLALDFCWNAAHAVEKYLKAALLMNGRSSIKNHKGKSYVHDIEVLFDEVHSFASELIPTNLKKPDMIEDSQWTEETAKSFIKRLNRAGDANNRYNILGFAQLPGDIYKLDILVFAIRRTVQRLDAPLLERAEKQSGAPKLTNLEYTLRDLGFQPSLRSLNKLKDTKAKEAVREAFLQSNFAFAPKNFKHEQNPYYSSSENPVLCRRILSVAKNARPGEDSVHVAIGVTKWALENIYFPNLVREQLKDALNKLELRLNALLQAHNSQQ